MMVSPFTFYRGAAKIMATDLKDTPTAGLGVQLCGDAHLSNFGVFASPERKLLFDLRFHETLPGPFEYDVKRMAASFTIAARNNGFSKSDTRASTMASVAAYREAMAGFADMRTMDIWYAHLDEDELMAAVRGTVAKTKKTGGKKAKAKQKQEVKAAERAQKTAEKTAEKAHTRDSLQALSKLGELVDGRYRIVSEPPIIVPARELKAAYGMSAQDVERALHEQLRARILGGYAIGRFQLACGDDDRRFADDPIPSVDQLAELGQCLQAVAGVRLLRRLLRCLLSPRPPLLCFCFALAFFPPSSWSWRRCRGPRP